VFEQRESSEYYSYLLPDFDDAGMKIENEITEKIFYNESVEKVVG
jgi:hypothetical protein